jgi:uncharacterized caspase-like protein
MARLAFLFIALIGLCGTAAWAQSETRVALVIGNGAYQHTDPLRNPVNDSRAMAKALREAGFEVIARENLTRRAFVEALHEFSGKVPPGGVGLFYYAGHGIQVRGVNHLVPVDATLANERDVKYETVDLNDVLNGLDEARARLSLVILDACRDNPFARKFRSASRGLAQTDAPRGTVIAYATAPGDTASDGDGTNGLYTTELLKAIAEPGLKLEEVFKRTIDGVARASGNKQTPWVSSSFRGDFFFNTAAAPPPAAAIPVPPGVDAVEQTAWTTIANSTNPAMFELFLQRFPNGTYADFARARLEELKAAAAREDKRRAVDASPPPRPADDAVEAALKLADIDRKRIQVALTARGFDTLGTDGAFGPRTRQMIGNWQRSRNEPATGFLTATQAALLSQEGQSALAKIEDERRKAEAERQKAAAAPSAPLPAPSSASPPPATAASADSLRFDGTWPAQLSCEPSKSAAAYIIHLTMTIRNGELTGHYVGRDGSQTAFKGRIQPDGSAMIAVDGATGDPKYALGNVAPGSRVSYQMAVRFSGRSASGTRVGGRPCTITMSKQ